MTIVSHALKEATASVGREVGNPPLVGRADVSVCGRRGVVQRHRLPRQEDQERDYSRHRQFAHPASLPQGGA
jgi:hypothetical protein